jgi:outer membrane receptor for ferrienterochelin and colicin
VNGNVAQTIAAANDGRGAEIELRGLGLGTTLTLVNGHRQPAGGTQGAFVDFSTIPLSAIDRVEILPDGASAIYGSDAIGGVVNFILRKDYIGMETSGRYSSAVGAAQETQISQLFGTTWSSGHILGGYQFYTRGDLPADDRALSAANTNFTAYGGSDFRYPNGNPGTILDSNNRPAYAIPKGQNGTNLTVSQLIPGAINYEDMVSTTDDLPRQQMQAAFFSLTQRIGDSLELSADGRIGSRRVVFSQYGQARDLTVPSTNPFYVNPFAGTDAVTVAYDFTKDLGPQIQHGTTDVYSIAVGAKGQLPGGWQIELTGTYGRQKTDSSEINLVDKTLYDAALADPGSATALNVFADGSNTNSDTLAGLRVSSVFRAVSDLGTVGIIADGELLALPAGAVKMALGADYRNEMLNGAGGESGPTASTNVAYYDVTNSRHVAAVFSEMLIPLAGESGRPSSPGHLELSLAGRYEDYSDFGHTFNPKLGLSFVAWGGIKLRGTWGTSFRAPPFNQTNLAFSPPTYFSSVVSDPKSATGQSNVLFLGGNNPNLTRETAHVWTAGLDWHPAALPDLGLSLTYFNIDYHDRISALSDSQAVLQEEALWAPIITRNPTAAQIERVCNSPFFSGDCSGVAAIVDARPRNMAVLKMRGVDADLSQSIKTGHGVFNWGVMGTYTSNDNQQLTADAPAYNFIDTVGSPLALRLRGHVSWGWRGFSTVVAVNYAGAYRDPGNTPDTVGAYTTVDLSFSYEFHDNGGWLADTQCTVGIVNVGNTSPPFVNQPTGFDSANFTLLGRMMSIAVNKRW